MTEEMRVEESKFDLGTAAAPVVDADELPWSYSEDRITAIVRDPDSAYLYWEITDEAIALARERLGPEGVGGWCNLRVYDTTARQFDGTNANDYFDIRVERTDREYFLMIRRPTSTIHVEVGVKSIEGYFQPIARSGRADFPRNEPSANTSVEWMTVTSDGTPPAATPCRSRYEGPEPQLPFRAEGRYDDVWHAPSVLAPSEQAEPGLFDQEWRVERRGGLRFTRVFDPEGEQTTATWHEGPFPIEPFDPERVAVELLGESPVHMIAEGTAITVYGPWRVVVRSFEEQHRRVLATWSMRWVRAMTPMIERWHQVIERRLVQRHEPEQVTFGASERRALVTWGASERWRLGGSERLWVGASEWSAWGASETIFLGASQVAWAAASASLQRGASERFGASERWHAGASRIGGASQHAIPLSERWGGRL
jgi:hypothetical protein